MYEHCVVFQWRALRSLLAVRYWVNSVTLWSQVCHSTGLLSPSIHRAACADISHTVVFCLPLCHFNLNLPDSTLSLVIQSERWMTSAIPEWCQEWEESAAEAAAAGRWASAAWCTVWRRLCHSTFSLLLNQELNSHIHIYRHKHTSV